ASSTPGASLGAAVFPAGETHSDEFFGEQEIYRGAFEIAIPYTRTTSIDALELEMGLQGCAAIGLCYPPQTWTSRVDVPPAAASTAAPAPAAARGPSLFGPSPADELLPIDEAFVMNARFDGP